MVSAVKVRLGYCPLEICYKICICLGVAEVIQRRASWTQQLQASPYPPAPFSPNCGSAGLPAPTGCPEEMAL